MYTIVYNRFRKYFLQKGTWMNLEDFARFSAQDIVDAVTALVQDEFNSTKERKKIIADLRAELIDQAWHKKLENITQRLYQLTLDKIGNEEKQEAELKLVFAELYDILAFLQILGGVYPNPPQNIPRNFNESFSLLLKMLNQITRPNKSFPQNFSQNNQGRVELLRKYRQEFLKSSIRTLAEILNANLQYFESPHHLNTCLFEIFDIDNFVFQGKFSSLLTKQLSDYYERLIIASFVHRPAFNRLHAALSASAHLNIDISKSIEFIPNDPYKFKILFAHKLESSKFLKILLECAEECDNPDTLSSAIKFFQIDIKQTNFDQNVYSKLDLSKLRTKFFQCLAEVLSNWINEFIIHDNPFDDPKVKIAYSKFDQMVSIIDTAKQDTRRKVLRMVRDTETIQFIRTSARGLKEDAMDKMSNDVKTILSIDKINNE